jgi:hypothetical protein
MPGWKKLGSGEVRSFACPPTFGLWLSDRARAVVVRGEGQTVVRRRDRRPGGRGVGGGGGVKGIGRGVFRSYSAGTLCRLGGTPPNHFVRAQFRRPTRWRHVGGDPGWGSEVVVVDDSM